MNDQHRRIDLEITVPAEPEQVWQAIATGPGISAWMHPTQMEERENGAFSWQMQDGPSGSGTLLAYEPPHRLLQQAQWNPMADLPPATLATEWIVEARDGGSSVVRMVMSGFGEGSGWDDELEGMTKGMRSALESLRAYLTTKD